MLSGNGEPPSPVSGLPVAGSRETWAAASSRLSPRAGLGELEGTDRISSLRGHTGGGLLSPVFNITHTHCNLVFLLS